MNSISIILLLKNGAKFLPEMLSILSKQKGVENLELVVVDSGSTDDGLFILEKQRKKITNEGNGAISSIKIIKIKPKEFSHGATRNLGVKTTTGEFVVFLTQDAIPMSSEWLGILLKPFKKDPLLAGVFGRQIPWPKTNAIEKYFYTQSYPNQKRLLGKNDSELFSNKNIFFSNVNGAARKELLLKFPFREDLVMSEDQFWGREVLRNGHKLLYEPRAEVMHSHNYNLKKLFFRYYQSGLSQRQMNLAGHVWKNGSGTFIGLIKYLVRNKPLLLPYAVIYSLVKGGAFFAGRKNLVPRINFN